MDRVGEEEVEEVVRRVEEEEGVHPNHWIKLRLNIRYCDLMKVIHPTSQPGTQTIIL